MKQLIKQLFCEHYYRDFKGIQNWESIYTKTVIYFSLCYKCGKAKNINITTVRKPEHTEDTLAKGLITKQKIKS